MAHLSSIGSAIFTDLAVALGTVASNASGASPLPANLDLSATTSFVTMFATEGVATGNFARIKNVREFPSVGTPANIVNVPVYGTKQSQTVQGQADAPSLEVTINYVAADWVKGASGTVLGNMVGDGLAHTFRFTLLQAAPTGTGATQYATTVVTGNTGVGTVQNTQFYWLGKVEAMLIKPDLKDAATAVLTLSIQSDFYGAFSSGA